MSDDGQHALVVIAFIGSVFSPYYAWKRRSGDGAPEDHVAVNVALYGRSGKRWAMTERSRGSLSRSRDRLSIGPSALSWDGNGLRIDIAETTVPFPSRIEGTVRLMPSGVSNETFTIGEKGQHQWQPIAPLSRVEVALKRPGLSWSGHAYLDSNWGAGPLEEAFVRWDWSRSVAGRRAAIFYDAETLAGSGTRLALAIGPGGHVERIEAPPACPLPSTLWRIGRGTRADAGSRAHVLETLEDTPFYARSLVSSVIDRGTTLMVHESLDCRRFRSPIVQMMLPFRMPRRSF